MIIDPSNKNSVVTSGGAKTKVAPEKPSNGPAGGAPTTPGDSVSLSSKAQALGRLEAAVRQAPDVDHDKVASIRQALAEGRYNIDNQRLAERMLEADSLF